MRQSITPVVLVFAAALGAGCVGTAEVDLTGEELSTIVTRLEGQFVLPDGSPAGGAEVTAIYGKQSLTTIANRSGEFDFPRWNILAHPGEVQGKYTDAEGHVWFATMPFRSLGEGELSVFVGRETLAHTTTLVGRLVRPDWVVDPPWCEITGGDRKVKLVADHRGHFRVELWPSDAQPIRIEAFAGERPNIVWASGELGPVEFREDSIELDLGEIEVRERAVPPTEGGGAIRGGL